jgi:methionine synthase II (cobalamin-independent)
MTQSPYTNDPEYFSDLVAAYQEEIAVLYSAGLRNIQIDAPELSFFCDDNIRVAFKEDGQDPDILLHTYIDVLNQCVAKTASDLHVGLHISPGILSPFKTVLNPDWLLVEIFESSCFAISSYDRIARAMFENVNVDTYYLDYNTL